MKRTILVTLAALCMASLLPSEACTNLIVGKNASADGSVICSYNADSFGFISPLSIYLPGAHQEGEMLAIRGFFGPGAEHLIAQAPYTYGVAGLMNEKQVTIVETTWGGRSELRNPEGWLGYYNLMELALQRATTAREAIAVIH